MNINIIILFFVMFLAYYVLYHTELGKRIISFIVEVLNQF
jgi:hypothetical protein